jgi:hypothetical protein
MYKMWSRYHGNWLRHGRAKASRRRYWLSGFMQAMQYDPWNRSREIMPTKQKRKEYFSDHALLSEFLFRIP